MNVVTLLSILSMHSIAVPLSPGYPAMELKYILDNSQAAIMLSAQRYEAKATEVMELDLESQPKHIRLRDTSSRKGNDVERVELKGSIEGSGGMMLYTSGTTARPVSSHNIKR